MDPNQFVPQNTVTTATSSTSPFDQTSNLDNPHVDRVINAGTTAPNCQPRHTREEDKIAAAVAAEMEAELELDDSMDNDNGLSTNSSADDNSSVVSTSSKAQRRRAEKKAAKEQARLKKIEEKKAAAAAKEKEEMDPRKMGYIQMARMGYQELVNAIIRPPRAEYKVSLLGKIAHDFDSLVITF